jgi:hypothetical protein
VRRYSVTVEIAVLSSSDDTDFRRALEARMAASVVGQEKARYEHLFLFI